MTIKLKTLAISIFIPLAVGALAGFISGDSMQSFNELIKPSLSPPGWVFPIVWPILYILMGISSFLVFTSYNPSGDKMQALKLYALQLVFNFFWSILFFNFGLYYFSFIWLVILWLLIALTIKSMYPISKLAAYLMIPYLLWVTFAGYLNLSIAILN